MLNLPKNNNYSNSKLRYAGSKKSFYKEFDKYYGFLRYYGIGKTIMRLPGFVYENLLGIIVDCPMNLIVGPKKMRRIYFKLFKFKCRYNLFVWKRNLRIGSTTMKSIYPLKYINPKEIKFRTEQRPSNYVVEDGDWDKNRRDVPLHPTIKELFIKKIPYQRTTQYKVMKKAMLEWRYNKSYWCTTEKEIDDYFRTLINAYNNIKKNGYKTQMQLRLGDNSNSACPRRGDMIAARHELKNIKDEIKVSIDRNGQYIMENAGNHRLSIAKLLNIKEVPVLVTRVHYLWWKRHRCNNKVHK